VIPGQPDYPAFAAAVRQLGLEITPDQFARLLVYQELLADWNTRINLISRQDTARILTYHIIDSLAVSRFIPEKAVGADIGSGAGLPGIPLAIVRSDLQLLLIESIQKKCHFLESASARLAPQNVRILCARSEQLPPLNCDILLSRLTADLSRTLRNCYHHLKPGGRLIIYKSENWQTELKRNARLLKRLNLKPAATETVRLPFTGIERRFIILTRLAAPPASPPAEQKHPNKK
jgi:16S rRNA (guanine527-N7)-methyltransferase